MSIIEKVTNYTSSNSTLPVLQRDALLQGAAGAMFLFDFCDAISNPNADGALPIGATFTNLVSGGLGGVVAGGNGIVSLTGQAGLSMPGSSNPSYITFGNTSTYDLNGTDPDPEFVVVMWLKTPSTGYTTTPYTAPFLFSPNNANGAQWWFDLGADGKTPRGLGTIGGASSGAIGTSGYGLGAVTQLALRQKPASGLYELYGNGALIASFSVGAGSLLSCATKPTLSAYYKGTVYRIYEENITASLAADSTRTAASVIALDYSLNSGRFI